MKASEILKPLGVFAVVIAVVLAGTALVGTLAGSGSAGPADGEEIEGQSPGQFAPENVLATSAPEDGEISIDSSGESKRILVDSGHSNRYSRSDLAPLVEALAQAGHEVDFTPSTPGDGGGFGETSYNATLRHYDAVLIVQPTASFSDGEIAGLSAYADGGGRIAVLAEPPQLSVGSGLSAQVTQIRFGAQDLVGEFGLRMGGEGLYNIEDGGNDNNYESIIASPDGSSALTEGVSNVTFDSAGYVVQTGDDSQVHMRALSGTRTLERRQASRYPVAAQSGNLVMVADTSFLKSSELYDLDNEQFAGNLLEFLVSGDKDEGVPQGSDGNGGFGNGGGDSGGGDGDTTPITPTP
ncbi:hypothetical protein C475_18073 [Halosimplex carlsbadense 2-9-1]|uniref:DUF4350 domain-containing protein n=1 Tax=Halosimplex carlsbadense 2-9-1 TaxID=797114 RepID=M0CGM9_9EURY|nr:DUF4350 domain-containing protein [Halosimplex carlsbadense]ELZ22445.1 hypothetical protein C475_18073 [Halosimplex carlsbadense 2-9-1]